MEAEAAGSVAASEASSGQHEAEAEAEALQAEDSLLQQGGSVNWGQATAQSPRVPRSQISRAHPAHAGGGLAERTSAVLSALSGDDETALSAAEAAGEHTSEPQEACGGMGEAQGEAPAGAAQPGAGAGGASAAGGGNAGAGALPTSHHHHHHHHHFQQHQQQLPALSLTAPRGGSGRGFELASSPPASTSPMYRANSVVSYTAAPPRGGGAAAQHPQAGQRRGGGETPASAAPAGPAQLLGSSPNTSRGEFSAALPRAPPRRGVSAGLPPTSGLRPGSAQQHPQYHHQSAAVGPSRPSLSGTQSQAPIASQAALSPPSTMAMAIGAFSPPGGGLLAHMTPSHGGLALPTPPPGGGLAGLLPLAASMGLQPSQLGSMAAALLQAQSSVLGTQHQQQSTQGQAAVQAPSGQGLQQQQHAGGSGGGAMPPPPPLQALQQAEALQNMAAMLQAQASAIMSGAPALPAAAAALQHAGAAAASGPAAVASEAGPLQGAVSAGAASVQSLPSLVGASAIQGHPLPPPALHRGPGSTPVPLQSFGGTPAPPAAAAAAPPTVQSGAFAAPGPLAVAVTPLHPAAAAGISEMQGSAIQPAVAALMQQAMQHEGGAAGGGDPLAQLAGPLQQAASAVLGSGVRGGGGGLGGSGSQIRPSPSSGDPDQGGGQEGQQRTPEPQAATIQELPTADVAAASQGGGAGGPPPGPALQPAVPQEAAMLGGNSAFGDAMELGGEEDEDAMEVQQEAAGGLAEGQDGHLPPAPHGAASVMATVMTDNGGGGRSEGDEEMVQQGASGPTRSVPGEAKPARSLSRSMAEPAAATAHNTGVPSGHTMPSQQGPAPSQQGQMAHALSSLATVSTGNGERAGGSVEMSLSQQQAQHATSAPAVMPAGAGAPHAAPLMGEGLGEEALSPPAAAPAQRSLLAAHPAASAPAAMPQQLQPQAGVPGQGQGNQGTPTVRPTASASMSGQGDTPGMPFPYGSATAAAALPCSSAAVPPPLGAAAATPAQQHAAHQAGGSAPAPALASLCEGQNDGAEPRTDARSRLQPAPAAAAAPPAPAAATIEGMGSPTASMHAAQPRESQGTARATILAGAAHSILTTAAAGEGEAMDEGGEALSPLLAAKALHAHLQAQAAAAAQAGTATNQPAAAAPGTGSVGGTPAAASGLPAAAAGQHAGSGGASQPAHANGLLNGHAKSHSQQQHLGAGLGGSPTPFPGLTSPLDYSTMAVELGPPLGAPNGAAEEPQPSASGQPSSLVPPGVVAAALAALEQQQAALNGGALQTPPPAVPAGLGELYQALQHQHNGYATHANSAIGNGHVVQSSPERELTSPSRLITHDSTGSHRRQQTSKQASKRRRTSAGPSNSSQHV